MKYAASSNFTKQLINVGRKKEKERGKGNRKGGKRILLKTKVERDVALS